MQAFGEGIHRKVVFFGSHKMFPKLIQGASQGCPGLKYVIPLSLNLFFQNNVVPVEFWTLSRNTQSCFRRRRLRSGVLLMSRQPHPSGWCHVLVRSRVHTGTRKLSGTLRKIWKVKRLIEAIMYGRMMVRSRLCLSS